MGTHAVSAVSVVNGVRYETAWPQRSDDFQQAFVCLPACRAELRRRRYHRQRARPCLRWIPRVFVFSKTVIRAGAFRAIDAAPTESAREPQLPTLSESECEKSFRSRLLFSFLLGF